MAANELEDLYTRFVTEGDVGALAEIFDRVAPELARLAERLVGQRAAAEDLVQETFLVALESPGAYDLGRPLVPWLVGILVNRSRAMRRADARHLEPRRLTERYVLTPDAEAVRREGEVAVEGALQELPTSQRAIVEARLHGIDSGQIADELGISQVALRGRYFRALARLRRHLSPSLAALLAVFLLRSTGLATARARVLAAGRRHPLAPTGAGAGGLAGFLSIGVLWMAKNIVVVLFALAFVLGGLGVAWKISKPSSLKPFVGQDSDEALAMEPIGSVAEPGESAAIGASQRRVALEVAVLDDAPAASVGAPLSGVIVDLEGRPIPLATARLWDDGDFSWPMQTEATPREVTTDNQGAFSFDGVGAYFVLVPAAEGMAPRRALRSAFIDDFAGTAAVELVLEPALTVTGRVLDTEQRGIEGATISVSTPFPYDLEGLPPITGAEYFGGGSWKAKSGPGGRFQIMGMPSSSVLFEASEVPYLVTKEWHRATEGELELVLKSGLSIAGRVWDAAGHPAVGARVSRPSDLVGLNTSPFTTLTDETGRFWFDGVESLPASGSQGGGPSNALLVLYGGHAVEVVQPVHPDATASKPLRIQLSPERVIAGRVVDGEGRPLPGAQLWVEGKREMILGFGMVRRTTWEYVAGIAETTADAEGRFRFEQLYDGAFTLHASIGGEEGLFAKLDVMAGSEHVEVVLDPESSQPATVVGRVVNAVTGEPVHTFQICPMIGQSGSISKFDDDTGHFEVSFSPNLEVLLRATALGYYPRDLEPQTFERGIRELNIELLPKRQLSILVVDSNGQPVENGVITAQGATSGDLWFALAGDLTTPWETLQSGHVLLKGLPAERVTLTIETESSENVQVEVDLTSEHPADLKVVIE